MKKTKMTYNLANANNFKLEIPDSQAPNYFIQSCSIPSINMGGIETPFQVHHGVIPR